MCALSFIVRSRNMEFEEHIQACDRRALRYMAWVSLTDRVPSKSRKKVWSEPSCVGDSGEQAEVVWTCRKTQRGRLTWKGDGDGRT